jgi:hypothetical protein
LKYINFQKTGEEEEMSTFAQKAVASIRSSKDRQRNLASLVREFGNLSAEARFNSFYELLRYEGLETEGQKQSHVDLLLCLAETFNWTQWRNFGNLKVLWESQATIAGYPEHARGCLEELTIRQTLPPLPFRRKPT